MENKCIVLADKHQNILEGLRGLLETVFASVVMVADQPSLVEALNKLHPQVAIIDLSLLGHGDLTASEINKRFFETRIIIMSDYSEPALVADLMSTGIAGFVLKQYAGIDLFEAIQKVQEGQTYISPTRNRCDTQNTKERE